jgi:hypothetical protein
LCYYTHRRWDDTIRYLGEVMEVETAYEQDVTWKLHAVAEIYLTKEEYDNALRSCNKVLEETERIVGEDHIQHHMSLSLLARIKV